MKTTYLKNLQLNHLFGSGSYIEPPTHYWVALLEQASADVQSEITLTGYNRIQTERSELNMPDSVNGIKVINATTQLEFGPFETTEPVTVSHFGIFDSQTGGNCYYIGRFTTPVIINDQDIILIAENQIQIKE